MTEAPPRPGFSHAFLIVLLVVVAFVVPALLHEPGWITHVDREHIPPEGWIGSATMVELLTPRSGVAYLPVVLLSLRLDHVGIPAADLVGFMHLHSMLVHALAGIALLFLLGSLGVGRWRAWFGAALFVVHPAVAETVWVIANRGVILAGLFTILTLYFVGRHARRRRLPNLVAAGGCALVAVFADPGAAILVLLAPLVAVAAGGRIRPAFLAVLPAFVGMATIVWSSTGTPGSFAASACLDPLLAIVWPRLPALVFDPVAESWFGVGWWSGVAALGCVAALGGVAWRLRSHRGLAVALAALVCAGLAAGVGTQGVGFATYLVVAAAGALVATVRLPASLPSVATVAATAAAVVVAVLSAIDIGIAPRFRDGASLWRSVADRNPVAATLLAAELARSELDDQRREALDLLAFALPRLQRDADLLRALELEVDVLARLGRADAASRSAEKMCELAERLFASDPEGAGQATVDRDRLLRDYLRAAECFTVEDSRAKIYEYFDKAQAIAPNHPTVVAAAAERLFAELVDAERAARGDAAIDVQPGWLRSDDPRLPAIDAKLTAALRDDSRNFRALLLKGRIAEATGAVLSALPFYEAAIAAGARRAEPRILLARLFMATDQPRAAEECVQRAMHDGVDDPSLHYLLANIYVAQGRRDDARRYLESYVQNRPGNRAARVLLANLLASEALSQGDRLALPELGKYAARIRELNPDDPKGLVVQAAVLCKDKSRRFVEAIVLLEKAQRAMPEDADVRRRLACAHRDYGWMLTLRQKRELAMNHFRTFLELAPPGVATEAVRNALEAHCRKLDQTGIDSLLRGDGAVAERSFARSKELLPNRPAAAYRLGISCFFQDKFEAARGAFADAIRLGRQAGEDVSSYVFRLVETLQRLDRAAEAKRLGEEYLKSAVQADAMMLQKIRELIR